MVVCAHLPGLGLSPSHVSSSCVFCVSLRVSLHPSRFSQFLLSHGKKPSAVRLHAGISLRIDKPQVFG